MTDKQKIGSFIKAKRSDKGYTQKELADMLYVTEWAVSKWERGISYPDITLIPDLCRIFDITEHEFLTASTDEEERRIKREARNYRRISGVWFLIPSISYPIALLICFICNLAVNHTLSWFFIVLTALTCAYTFIPTVTVFVRSRRLLTFIGSTYLSICLLLFTCGAYTDTLYWVLTACIGVLIGYNILFFPIITAGSRIRRYRFIISLTNALILTLLLLLSVNVWYSFNLGGAILITLYAYAPVILSTFIFTLPIGTFTKFGASITLSVVPYYPLEYIVDVLFGTNNANYEVNFNDWANYVDGNVTAISFGSLLLTGLVLLGVGILRLVRKTKDKKDKG